MPRCQHSSPIPTSPISYVPFLPSSMILPGLGSGDTDAPFMTGKSTCCFSQYFDHLWVSEATAKEVFLTKADGSTVLWAEA